MIMKKILFVFLILFLISNLQADIKRVVSMMPSITQTIIFLGAEDRLVGISEHDNYPESIDRLPKIASFSGVNYELLVKLNPDMVFLSNVQIKDVNKLKALNIKYTVIKSDSIEDIFSNIVKIGKILEIKDTLNKLKQLKKEYLLIRAKSIENKRVLMVIGNSMGELKNIYIAGNNSFLGEILAKLDYENAYKGNVLYPKVSLEDIIKMRPDVIVLLNEKNKLSNSEKYRLKLPWLDLRDYLPDVKIVILSGDYVFIPGPRFIKTMKKLQNLLETL